MLSESAEHAENEDTPQDNDSLFGSPPPSPSARGRSPSPTLALPCASLAGSQNLSFCSSAQKVGTIALPGSHSHSEPPVNLIAPSLSLPGGSCTPFLPQPIPSSQPQSRQSSIGRSVSRVSAANRPYQTSTQTRIAPQQTRRSAPKRKLKSPTPRPPPPVIPLPDPSQPPPANFLRNQQALLGHAGLIAGVKPSKLATLNGLTRGANPSNPIILDDNEGHLPQSAMIGRSYIDHFNSFDGSKLPTPTIQEVVDVLIKQRDIFTVLQSILGLLAAGATGEQPVVHMPPGWIPRPVQGQVLLHPSVKRRKLNRVPAGAVDWDVPFPFMDGEGPEAYRQTWLKERGRQLISQVIGLVKMAINKAATKKHIEQLQLQKRQKKNEVQHDVGEGGRKQGGKGANHYRIETRGAKPPPSAPSPLAEDPPSSTPSQCQAPSTVESMNSEEQPASASAVPNIDNAVFNDLISALLSASESTDAAPLDLTLPHIHPSSNSSSTSHPSDDISANLDLSSATDELVDQSLVDSWMNILQTFPQPTEESGISFKTPLESLFGVDTPDFSAYTSPISGDLSTFSTTPNQDTQQSPTLNFSFVESLDIALNLVVGDASESPAGQSQVLTDFAFDLPVLSHTNATQNDTESTPMDISEPCVDVSKVGQFNTITSSPSPPMMDIDHFTDPKLDNNSPPSTTGVTQVSCVAATGEVQNVAFLNTLKTVGTHRSSAFLPSPVSTLEPATPSSAEWDTSLPEVVAGDQSGAQGTWWDAFLASTVATDSTGSQDIGGQFDIREVEMAIGSQRESTRSGVSLPKVTHKRSTSRPPPTAASGQASESTSTVPVAAQPPGVFSVLRVQDWQPQRSTRKPKKADVLKKAEERRTQLKARLEELKVKLWETTIEHGALLHLMRSSGAEERESNASTSDS